MKPRIEIHFRFREQLAFVFGTPYRPQEREYLLNHARSGILLALQSLNLPAGGKVGVMAYNCHTVFNAVAQAGFHPVFLDVTSELKLDIEDLKAKKSNICALVVTHLFGIQNNLEAIRSICPGIPIIEDCAHAFGIESFQGDFSITSIGQGKLLSVGDGGIMYVNNDSYIEDVDRLYRDIPNYTILDDFYLFGLLWIRGLLYHPFVYKHFTEPMKRRKAYSSGMERIKVQKMSNGIRRIYETERRQVSEIIRMRKQNAKDIIDSITDPSISFCCGDNAFMLVAQCETPDELRLWLRDRGIDSATHFAHSLDWARNFGYQKGMCPKVEYLTKHLLMIPTYGYEKA